MSMRIALVLLTAGLGLTIALPLVGILTMVAGAFGLAIVQEDDLGPLAEARGEETESRSSNVFPFRGAA